MLSVIFVLFCVVFIILYYDIELRFRSLFAPGTLQKRMSYITWKAPRMFFSLTERFLDCHFTMDNTSGKELPEQFMIIANHQSLMDIPVFFFFFAKHNVRFVSKKELGRGIPLISQILRNQEHCLIDRRVNQMQAMKSLETFARKSVENRWCPIIFPEGTRSKDGYILPFHTAGVRRMLSLGPMPVLSVAVNGGWKISTLIDLLKLKNSLYQVRILNVYDAPQTKQDSAELLDKIHAEISVQVNEWNGRPKQ